MLEKSLDDGDDEDDDGDDGDGGDGGEHKRLTLRGALDGFSKA